MIHDLRSQFQFLSKANSVVNDSLIHLLRENLAVLEKPLSGFFPHTNSILAHIYVADMLWMADISFSIDSPLKSHIVVKELPQYETFRIGSFDYFVDKRRDADEQLLILTDRLRDEDLSKTVADYDAPGSSEGHPTWKALQHVFNHQTHHRGQISLALELFGVKHSYSNLIDIK